MDFRLPEIAQYGSTLVLAFIVSLIATPLVRRLAIKTNVMDCPGEARRIHQKPVAKMGGLAIALSFFSVVGINLILYFLGVVSLLPSKPQLFGMLSGLSLIMIMGLLDDIQGLSPYIKFAFQFAAAGIVVASGTKIVTFTNPFIPQGWSTLPPTLSVVITLLWIVGITNAINFIDGLDGLAAGVSSISLISLFIISIILGTKEMLTVSILIAALSGAILGFLPYNINPAKIFMTDIGSNFIGFALAVIAIQGALKSYAAVALAIPILSLGLPFFDVVFAIIRRVRSKRKITEADRGHLHHKLLDLGFTQKQVVFILYIVSALMGACAIFFILTLNGRTSREDAFYALLLMLAVSILFTLGVRLVYFLSGRISRNQTKNQEATEVDENEET